jgi:HD-GYP domain-containing protein (c-di-GMP phosphodiesterase class II)
MIGKRRRLKLEARRMEKKRIQVDDLRFGMYVLELDRPWLGTPFLFQGFPIVSDDQIRELKKYCRTVYIDPERQASTGAAASKYSEQPLVRGSAVYRGEVPFETELPVAREIYSSFEQSVQQTLEMVRRTGDLDARQLTAVVGRLTRSVERNPDAMMLLHRMQQKSNEEFNRAVDNSIHMITFGRFLQFPSERLELLGLAGLLLDIGKVNLPEAILQKKDKLTAEEYEASKQHVMHSIKLIHEAHGLPSGLAEIVVQHHERLDGSGYPHGLSGGQISIDGAIAGLINTYCALVSKRTYAEQISPSNALGMIYKLRGTLFHDALAEQLIQCIGIYPVGSTIELNTGEIGVVIAQNLVRRLQPRIMLILDHALKPIRPQLMLDLVKEPKSSAGQPYQIKRTVPNDQLPIDLHEFFL